MIQAPENNSDIPHAQPTTTAATLLMGGMVRCDQMGIYEALGNLLRTHGHRFQPPRSPTEGDGKAFGTLCHLRSRYREARSIEARHGRGALLNLDHRDVATMVWNRQLLTEVEVEAAKTFRKSNAAFYAGWRDDAAMMPSTSGSGPAIWVPLGS